MKLSIRLLEVVLILFLYGCSPSVKTFSNEVTPSIEVDEVKVDTISVTETIHLNNCDGTLEKEETSVHSLSFNIIGFDNTSDYEIIKEKVLNKYSQYKNMDKTQKVVAPSNTNMEFDLAWTDNIHTGTIRNGVETGIYNIKIPASVNQISSRNLGCTNSSDNPKTDPTVSSQVSASTSAANSTALESSKETNVESLKYCSQLTPNNCVYAVQMGGNKTISIYFNLEQSIQGDYYCLFDKKEYVMEPIAGYENKYVCRGFPLKTINKTIDLQIFALKSLPPVLEGKLFIDGGLIYPTETPKPPQPRDPYNP